MNSQYVLRFSHKPSLSAAACRAETCAFEYRIDSHWISTGTVCWDAPQSRVCRVQSRVQVKFQRWLNSPAWLVHWVSSAFSLWQLSVEEFNLSNWLNQVSGTWHANEYKFFCTLNSRLRCYESHTSRDSRVCQLFQTHESKASCGVCKDCQ